MNLNEFAQLIYQFFKRSIWTINLESVGKLKRLLIVHTRIFIFAIRGFMKDKNPLQASALTYYSLLSLVPIAALAFGLSKGFGVQEALKQKLLTELPEHKEVVEWIITFANSLLEVSSSGLITGLGVLLLLWSAIRILGNIEDAMNTIWKVTHSRTFIRKFSDYLTIMIIGPVLIIVSSSMAVSVITSVASLTKEYAYFDLVDPLMLFVAKLIPYSIIWLLFTIIYMVIPNTKVNYKAAIYGALIAGSLYQLVQWFYIEFQLGATKYSAIYGSFAALPLFLFWLQLSWFILLFGVELSYAFQRVPSYIIEKKSGPLQPFIKKSLLLTITYFLVQNFKSAEKALSTHALSKLCDISENQCSELLEVLSSAGIIVRIASKKGEKRWQPAKDINTLYIQDVVYAVEHIGQNDKNKKMDHSNINGKMRAELERFEKLAAESSLNTLIKDIPNG